MLGFLKKKPMYEPETGIHRAHLWEIALYAMNNTSTNTYLMAFNYITYFLTGIVGVSVVMAGSITTIMRMWDGVTDPFVGMVVDHTNTKFGKNRPFILIGNLILFVTSFSIYRFIPGMPAAARFPAYIIMYMLYIIGYTCQCVVTKSAQTCLTNDPEQRPIFSVFDTIYNSAIFAVLPVYVVGTLMPKHGGADAFSNPAMFQELQLFCGGISFVFAIAAIIALWRKDRQEYFGTGQAQAITFKDYADVLVHNRAIQMLVVSAASDKLTLSMQSNAVVYVMLFGIVCADYSQYSAMSAVLTPICTVLGVLLIMFVAPKMGQKTGLLVGTWGGIIGAVLMFFLFRFGNPHDLAIGTNWNFFTLAFCFLWIIIKGFCSVSSGLVITMTADCADYETFRSGKYVPGLMGTLFSFVDKMISSLAGTFVSLMIAGIGFKTEQPTPDTPYSEAIFWVAMGCFLGAPLLGWACNVVAMKFYPLSKEYMESIQEKIAEIKKQYESQGA